MITVLTKTRAAVGQHEITEWLRLPQSQCGASELATLNTLATAGTVAIEERLRRKMVISDILKQSKEWERKITLPWSPFVSLESFTYTDENGNEQTVDPETYEIIENAKPAYIKFKPSVGSLPNLDKDKEYPIEIRYTVGEAPSSSTIPEEYKQVILMAVASGYMNRASLSSKTLQTEAMQYYINELLKNKRVMRFG